MNDEPREMIFTVPAESAGTRADAFLAAASGLSRSRVQSLIEEGRVTRPDGSVPDAKRKVAAGDVFTLRDKPPEPVETLPQDIPLDIVFEDDAILVVNKPAGLVVHPAAGHPDGTLVNAVLHHCPDVLSVGGEQRPGIVHRLDRDTSGLIVIAKTDAALNALAAAFQAGEVHKTYAALVCGTPHPASGHVEGLIGRSPRDRKKMAVVEKNGKFASTDWEIAEAFGTVASLLSVRIHTGRTHQIRVHMASIGHPVSGDADYGSPKRDAEIMRAAGDDSARRPPRQMLHARHLELAHPITGEPLAFDAPLPPDFADLVTRLRRATV